MPTNINQGALRLELYQGLAGLDAIAGAWRVLAGQCAQPTFSHYPEWYECYLRCLAPDPDNVFFCLLRRDRVPVAVAPLERRFTRTAGILRRSLILPQDEVHMPVADFTIASTERMEAVAQAILAGGALLPELHWDRMHLARVSDNSCCINAIRTQRDYILVQRSLGFGDRVALAPFDQMLHNLSKSARNNLTLAHNRLARVGNVRFCTVSDEAALAKAVEELIIVEGSGWKGRAGTAIQCDPRQCTYFRMLTARFGVRRQCDIHTLYVHGRPAAVTFAISAGNMTSLIKSGYDETYASLSPGNLLDAYVMQYYFENTSVRVVDMLSDYAYLRMWKPTRHAVFNLSVFKRSLSGFLDSHGTRGLYALQDIHGATTHKAINMLRRLDLFGRSPK